MQTIIQDTEILNLTEQYIGLFKMIGWVLTTWHTQYT